MDNQSDDTTQKKLGEKLKQAREKLGLTQSEVALKAKINANYYAKVERGEADLAFVRLNRVFKVLGIKSPVE
jgi:transcriptional regulator with XRE-family HTH domain